MKVKICGITNTKDAVAAALAGANYVGLNFASGPRKIDETCAKEILEVLGGEVSPIAVFMDASVGEIHELAGRLGIEYVQLHGEEPPETVELLSEKYKVIKTIKVSGPESLMEMPRYKPWAFLLDTSSSEAPGGTGESFDWSLAAQATEFGQVFLAGGLNPDNVGQAVKEVHPFAVDAASGLESSPGVKDHDLMAKFVINATHEQVTREVTLEDLKPGVQTGGQVSDERGRTILAEGVTITPKHIEHFQRLGVKKISIIDFIKVEDADNAASDSTTVSAEDQHDIQELNAALEAKFENTPESNMIRPLLEEAAKRLNAPRIWQ